MKLDDIRYWYADRTCSHLQLETSANLAALSDFLRWTIPSGQIGVIREILIASSSDLSKNVIRFILRDSTADQTTGIPLNGALRDVQEIGSDGLNYKGLIVISNSGPRECLIPLMGGKTYRLTQLGAPGVEVFTRVYGWVWNVHEPPDSGWNA